jgi:hypothetical protein
MCGGKSGTVISLSDVIKMVKININYGLNIYLIKYHVRANLKDFVNQFSSTTRISISIVQGDIYYDTIIDFNN